MIDKMLLEQLKSNFYEAGRIILINKVRTFLTALGIIFGVAAVIAMMSIGKGAEKEILAQLELIGVNNIVITPIADTEKEGADAGDDDVSQAKRFSKGLDVLDVKSMLANIPSISLASPEIVMETYVSSQGRQNSVKLIGVSRSFFEVSNIKINNGRNFSVRQARNALPVCIIGKTMEKKLFPGSSALGKQVKVKDVWLKVVGVIEEKYISDEAKENLSIRDLNLDIYIPIKSFLVRYRDRKIVVDKVQDRNGGFMFFGGNNSGPKKRIPRGNYHQLDKLVVQVKASTMLQSTANIIGRMLKRRHNNVQDFKITIPIQLLKQQQKTKQIFNVVLSIIAGISLLIGGIGIMNIMLASVLERTKEIGIIRALGATKQDVILQFLAESVLISIGGGVLGIILGIVSSYIIEFSTGIETILTVSSIVLSFIVATVIGLVFGIMPAKSAANKNPIEAIRHE